MPMCQLLLISLPVFAVLIALEWAYSWKTGRSTYRINDVVSSLSQGVLSQAVAVCTKLFQIGLYTFVFTKLALLPKLAWWSSAAGWLAAIVLFDFCDYWLHRAGHEIAILWAAHVVHHQSEAFNLSTALRQESFVPLFGWVFYVPMALLGVPPEQFAVAGLIVLLYQFWIHTEHIGKLGWFDRIFSSPSNHRVHHAINPQYINKNYGGMLVIWDRLFGTFAEENEACIYGTKPPLRSWDPVWAVTSGYAALAQDAMRTRRLRDKLRLWFMPPGWRPADLRESTIAQPLEPGRRFDPALHRSQVIFVLVEFVLLLAITAMLLLREETLDESHAIVLCLAIAGGLWLIGAVLQSRLRVVSAVLATVPVLIAAVLGLM
jgi:alkylglycerol monooxygenase